MRRGYCQWAKWQLTKVGSWTEAYSHEPDEFLDERACSMKAKKTLPLVVARGDVGNMSRHQLHAQGSDFEHRLS